MAVRHKQPEWTLAGRITAARQTKQLSIADVSKKIGVSRVTLYAWEDGKSIPALDALVEFSRLTETSLDWLAKREGPEPEPPPD